MSVYYGLFFDSIVGAPRVLLIVLFFLLGLVSCSDESGFNSEIKDYDVKIENGGCFYLLPDFEYNYSNYAGYTDLNLSGARYLSNVSNGMVYTFSLKTGEMYGKQEIIKEGPRSVGARSPFNGVFVLDENNYLHSSNVENKIILVSEDTVRTIVDYTTTDSFRLVNHFSNVPIAGANHILFPIYPGSKEFIGERFTFVAIDKELNTSQEVISGAQVYGKNYYGGIPYFYWPSIVYNPQKKTYIVSFPVDHNLYEYNADFDLIAVYPMFHELVGEIKTYDKPLDENGNGNWQEEDAYYASTNQFLSIFYLEGARQYVRIGRLADPESDEVKYCAFVYDDKFSKTKSFILSPDYSVFNAFGAGKSLYILNKARLESDRSVEIPFDCLTFSEQ